MERIRTLFELGALFRRMWVHFDAGRRLVAATVLASMLAAVMEGVGVGLLVPLVELLQRGGTGPGPGSFGLLARLRAVAPGRDESFYLACLCALVAVAVALKNAVTYGSQLLAVRLVVRVTRNLRLALFAACQRADISLFEVQKSGEMSSVFTSQTTWAVQAVEYLLILLQRSLLALAYFGLLLWLSWQVSLALLMVFALVAVLIGLMQAAIKRHGIAMGTAYQRLGAFLSESFAGIRITRVTHAQDQVVADFGRVADEVATAERRGKRLTNAVLPLAETLGMISAMAVVAWAFQSLIVPGRLQAAALMGIGLALMRLLPIQNQILSSYGQLTFTANGLREIERWLKSPSFPRRSFGALRMSAIQQGIELTDVSYVYPNGTRALNDVSFTIPAGRRVALVGASGSGKSTIASLLMRLRQPTSGRILVDGVDYWEFTPGSWHARMGVVEQEPFLFHDTIARNLCYGLTDVSAESVAAAIGTAHLDGVVKSLPAGLDTVVGERGAMLSGGQRQRLAIARAVVRNPQLLILDEATSALDSVSEREVQRALEEAMHGRTALIIAHRLSTVRNADYIVVLDGGNVVEQGTWADLLARGGVFARLVKLNELRD